MTGKCCNGRGCCSAACVTLTTVIVVTLVGIGFIGSGLSTLIVRSVHRRKKINIVDAAVEQWNNPSSPSSWTNLQQLNAYVSLTVGSGARSGAACQALSSTTKLTSGSCPVDYYQDEAGRFQGVKQLALCASVDYRSLVECDLQVEFLVVQPGASSNTSLVQLPDLVPPNATWTNVDISMAQIEGKHVCSTGKYPCRGSGWEECVRTCRDVYGGALRCTPAMVCYAPVGIADMAVKVSYSPGSSRFSLDARTPSLGSGGFGANVLPKGFRFYGWNPQVGEAPLWQYEKLTFIRQPPTATITIRSSGDPWLAYLAATQGSMYFETKGSTYFGLGIALICIGGVVLLAVGVFLAYLCYARALYHRSPKDQPPGCCKGGTWRLGSEVFGASGSSVVPEQQQQQMLVATPVAVPYAQPAVMYQPQAGAVQPVMWQQQQPGQYGAGQPPEQQPQMAVPYAQPTVMYQPQAVAVQPVMWQQQQPGQYGAGQPPERQPQVVLGVPYNSNSTGPQYPSPYSAAR